MKRATRQVDERCATELGKDAFHRVPDFGRNEWDAVECVLAIAKDRFMGKPAPVITRAIPGARNPVRRPSARKVTASTVLRVEFRSRVLDPV